MTKPASIDSAARLAATVQPGLTTESLFLDFKATLDKWNVPKTAPNYDQLRQEAQKETCRDIAQFANTDGGCLVVGISEKRRAAALKVADAIVGVAEPDGMRQWIEQAICNYLVPSTFTHEIVLIHSLRALSSQ